MQPVSLGDSIKDVSEPKEILEDSRNLFRGVAYGRYSHPGEELMLNEIKTTKVLDITSAALIKGIRGKKLSPAQKKQAKQYREELFEEYAAGEMSPEKKALILNILGPNFFAPVDKFEAQCKEVE